MSNVQDIPLPVSVATADDLSTSRARTANGRVVSTTGRSTPGDNGAAAYIYRRSGRSGVTLDTGAFVAGPGVDDYWEVVRKNRLDLAIYPVDATGVVDCSGHLLAADAVEGETLIVDEGTYLVQADVTLTRRVEFAQGAKFKIADGYTLTLSGGYVAQDTQHVFDISLGGEVEVDDMARVSVAHWGAVPDYVYPSTGTNSSPAIQAAFDAAENIAATKTWREPNRPEVFVPPGSYRLNTVVALGNRPNLYAAGANFVYFGSQASDDAILTIGGFTTVGQEIELGTFFLPSVQGLMDNYLIPQANEEFVGIRIDACGSSVFHCEVTKFVPIGLQLRPYSKTYVAHNHFLNHKAWAVKVGIDFVWSWDQDEVGNVGWSNENVFTNCNQTTDGSSKYFGSIVGCRMRNSPGNTHPTLGWDIGGVNNNRFFGQCYQPGNTHNDTKLVTGLVVVQNQRYVNYTTRQEYICNVAGTVATIPTNTDLAQSPADANGVRFTHCGPYFRSGVLLDKCGGFNLWHGTRWEYGDGAFCYIANSSLQIANVSRGNEIVLYDYARQNEHRGGKILIDDYTIARRNELCGYQNVARIYGQELNSKHVINDMHKRFIASEQALMFRGMVFWNPATKLIGDYAAYGMDDWILMKNAVQQVSWQCPGVVVDLTDSRRISSHFVATGEFKVGNNVVVPLDQNDDTVIVATDTQNDCVSSGYWSSVNQWGVGGEPLYFGLGSNADITKAFVGIAGGPASLSTHLELQNVPGGGVGTSMLAVTTPDKGRFSLGVPTGGFFLEHNEFIRNYTTEAYSSSGWRVKRPGILAKPWTAATAVKATELRMTGPTQAFTATHGTNTITAVAHGLLDGDRVWTIGADLPDGLSQTVEYFVKDQTSDTFKVSLTLGGTEVDLLDNGTGTMLLMPSETIDKVYAALHSSTAKAWQAGTYVDVGDLRLSDTNKIYIATLAGYTGGIAPTGTGTNISDGALRWDYVRVAVNTGNTPPTGTGSSISDDNIPWEYIGATALLEEVFEGAALSISNPPITGNLTLRSDGTSSNWYKANTYISEKVLSGDFDITFKVVDTGQSHRVGVTADTAATDFNNYQNFDFGVQWFIPTELLVCQRAVDTSKTIAGWGNFLVRMVRTGTAIDLYIDDVLVPFETATITANAGTDVITSAGHGLVNGRPVRFEGVDLPDGIVEGTVYFVRDATTDTFKIAATIGGAAINILDAGTGTQTFFANAISSADMHVMYSAYDTVDSEAIIYNDDYKPTNLGGSLVAVIDPLDEAENTVEAVPFSATARLDFSAGRSKNKTMTLTSNATGLIVVAPVPGVYYATLTQDATGGRTVAFATTIIGTAPTMASGANASTLHAIYSNGTDLFWM